MKPSRIVRLLAVVSIISAMFLLPRILAHAADPAWQETAPGIAVRTLPAKGDAGAVPVVVVRIDLSRAELKVRETWHGGQGEAVYANAVCPPKGAAINASFFDDKGAPIGLLVVDGKRLQRPLASSGCGLFMMHNGRPRMQLASDPLPTGITQGVQGKPRLVVDGRSLKFKAQAPTRRSAVGIDGNGRVILAATDGDLTHTGR